MGKNERLIDQLQKGIQDLDDDQRKAFKESLKRQIPGVIKQAVEDAKVSKGNDDDN